MILANDRIERLRSIPVTTEDAKEFFEARKVRSYVAKAPSYIRPVPAKGTENDFDKGSTCQE